MLKSQISRRCCENFELYTKHSWSLGALPKTCKKWGSLLKFFARSAGRCFTPVMEIKPNSVSLRWNFYADTQLIRWRFWLQLWTLKKFSEPRVSWKYLAKMWKNSEMTSPFAATSMGAAYCVRRTALCCALLFIALFTTVVVGGGGGGLVYVI